MRLVYSNEMTQLRYEIMDGHTAPGFKLAKTNWLIYLQNLQPNVINTLPYKILTI